MRLLIIAALAILASCKVTNHATSPKNTRLLTMDNKYIFDCVFYDHVSSIEFWLELPIEMDGHVLLNDKCAYEREIFSGVGRYIQNGAFTITFDVPEEAYLDLKENYSNLILQVVTD